MDMLLYMYVVVSVLVAMVTIVHGDGHVSKSALIIVDVQDCFVSGGSLAVTGGDEVVPVINSIRQSHHMPLVVVSQDWHCPRHISFASSHTGPSLYDVVDLNYTSDGDLCLGPTFSPRDFPRATTCPAPSLTLQQVMWPDHCVAGVAQGPTSSSLVNTLVVDPSDVIIKKGNDCDIDSYSVFFDNGDLKSTGLEDVLKAAGIDKVFVTGLALDYCVYNTALDARRLGFETFTVLDASRGVAHDSTEAAKADMMAKGIHLIYSQDIGDAMMPSGSNSIVSYQTLSFILTICLILVVG